MSDITSRLGFDVSDALAALARLDRSLANTETAMGNFGSAAKGFDASKINQSLDSIAKTNERLTVSFGLMSRVIVTQALVRALSGIRDAFSSATEGAMDFNKRVSEVLSISGGQLGGLDDIKSRLAGLSAEYGVSLKDVSEATYQVLSNQIAQGQDVYRFLQDAMIFSKAGVTSLDISVNLLSGTLNAYGMSADQAAVISSKFFRTIELGRVRASELAAGMGKVAPIARELGVSVSELDAAIATVTVSGSKAAEAFTAVRGVFSGLLKPSDATQAALQQIGFASGEQAVAALGLKGTLDALRQTTDGSAGAMAQLFPAVRALNAALRLTGSGAETFAKNLREIDGVSNDLVKSKAFEIMSTNAATAAKEWNRLTTAIVTGFGEGVRAIAPCWVICDN